MTIFDEASEHAKQNEIMAMMAMSLVVVCGVSALAAWLDLSGMQTIKISIGHIILGGMLIGRAADSPA